MPAYALLLRPAANRLYSKGAAALTQAELSVLNERRLNGSLHAVEPAVIGGVDYVRFSAAATMSTDDVARLSNLSSAFALFQIAGDGRLVPVALTPRRAPRRRFADDPALQGQDQRAVHQAAVQRDARGVGPRR